MSTVRGGDPFRWAADLLVSLLGPVDAETEPDLHKTMGSAKGK